MSTPNTMTPDKSGTKKEGHDRQNEDIGKKRGTRGVEGVRTYWKFERQRKELKNQHNSREI